MSVSRADVEKIAALARLHFEGPALENFTTELNEILGYVELLKEVDTSNVEPLHHVWDTGNVLRDDVPKDSLPQEEALANAPQHDEEFFLVPRVIE
jgi:aspartyl-tRNA(Asn)/glutamyl-tRNA(Gln) amidotransferase subunit C